jgi:hypothetical protein
MKLIGISTPTEKLVAGYDVKSATEMSEEKIGYEPFSI